MDYENFKKQFVEDVKKKIMESDINANISIQEINKLNMSYDAITVTPEESNMGVNINMNHFFSIMEDGTDYDAVLKMAVDVLTTGINERPEIEVSTLTDYEQMKNKLVMEVVSSEVNAELLTKIPHKEMEDMAVVYRFELDSNEDGRATILITNHMISVMGITPEQLYADAMENAPQLKPAVITGMKEAMIEIMGREEAKMMGVLVDEEEKMFVATVPNKNHGAGIIAYQNFMEQATERVGGDFYILPSSVHEILLVSDNGQIDLLELQDMVREVNETQVSPEEKLTDNVYHYDSKDKIFELGEKFLNRQAEKETALGDKSRKDSVLNDLKAKKHEVSKQPKKENVERVTKGKGKEL